MDDANKQDMFPAYLKGIETKNESVNDRGDWLFPAYLKGIETKFEEQNKTFRKGVSGVPKRNWNYFLAILVKKSVYPVSGVPKRNWNKACLKRDTAIELFSAYLWGIETN